MKTLKMTWKGVTPLLMNDCKGVNVLLPLVREKKKYTGKRTKTEEDLATISDLEWEIALYWNDEVGVHVPVECIAASIINGAKSIKKGKDVERYTDVQGMHIPLDYGAKLSLDELRKDYKFRDVRAVAVKRARVIRTRARFTKWSLTFDLTYDEQKIDIDTIVQAVDYAGKYVGLCDYRPKYGKFEALIEEVA